MRSIISISIAILLLSSCFKEDNIAQDRVSGLYRREYYDIEEFLLLKQDFTYEYFTTDPIKKVLSKDKWFYSDDYGHSEIILINFNYMMGLKKYTQSYSVNKSVPILYSHAKKNIVFRMDIDIHQRDFSKLVAD